MIKKISLLFFLTLFIFETNYAQQARIINEAVSPEKLIKMNLTGTTNSVSTGLNIVPNGTYVYVSPKSISSSDPVLTANWSFISKPSGSNAQFSDMADMWANFKTDIKGAYTIKLSFTTAKGIHDTTLTIYSADFIGNPAFDGVQPQGLNCMTCHSSNSTFTDIYERWQNSGHANIFKTEITTGALYYGTSCMKCHTVGYDHNVSAGNNGFDDNASTLGWEWQGPPNSGKWDTLKIQFPGLVAFAQVGCESCHGPAGAHVSFAGPSKETIAISAADGACASCHDEPWRHNKVSEYENSKHSEAVWSISFAQASNNASYMKNNLGNCIRCHDAKGYINFTKGKGTDTQGMVEAQHISVTCATCHDPHGNSNEYSLRITPSGSDTLATGFKYSGVGTGEVCMNCHKNRTDVNVTTKTKVNSSHWGPHHSNQADIFLGKNMAEFGTPYTSVNVHQSLLQNACVDCHMQATTDTGTVTRDRVGGHSFSMKDDENNFNHTKKCQTCHGAKTKWSEFTAKADYDGDGTAEGIQDEVKGLLTKLRIALPPVGVDSISYTDIGTLNDEKINKAYWNYLMVENDGSYGMHNASYIIEVLQSSLTTTTGVEQDNTIVSPKTYELSQNFPNPFNPTTTIQFALPKAGNVSIKIYDAVGNEVATLHNGYLTSGSYKVNWNAYGLSSGVYYYKLSSQDFSLVKKMVLMK